jgi:catechol 2,3-dioxygenase-like lactoylglutathione lyase family enzyme
MTTRINTLYYYCNDVARMRHFYIHLLGLEETFYQDTEKAGWLTMQVGEVNVVFVRGAARPVPAAFAKQLGFAGGTLENPSWVLDLPAPAFDAAAQRLQQAGAPRLTPAPTEPQPGYRQFVVRDPMGNTIELYSAAPHPSS